MQNLIGKTIKKRYKVESLIGRGGMAEVYKVYDQKRASELAIKVLREDLARDKIFLRRFQREAQTLAKLQHRNIVRFYGLEQEGMDVFLVMDYIEGESLRDEIFRVDRPFSSARIFKIIESVCSALHFAHEMGIAHCDVKPANILLAKNGEVLISDFGIARMVDSATSTMVGIGSPAYMAPELVRGQDPTLQTDIYSLGIVLYEMLTGGERPFTGERAEVTGTTAEKVRWEQVKLTPVPPSKYNKSISKSMESAVLHCLEKEPGKRFSSSMELLNALPKIHKAAKKKAPATPVKVEVPSKKTSYVRKPEEKKTTSFWKQWYTWIGIGSAVVVLLLFIILNRSAPGEPISGDFILDESDAGGEPFPTPDFPYEIRSKFATPLPPVDYILKEGDTISQIGQVFDVSETSIRAINILPQDDRSLVPGQTILVPQPTPTPPPLSGNDWEMVSSIDGMVLLPVLAGEFITGSEYGDPDQSPMHTVFLDAFLIDETEVTNTQYRQCVDIGTCDLPSNTEYYDDSNYNNHPVVNISWYDANDYCQWVGRRLPTEAEWEKAARGTQGFIYPWGNTFDKELVNVNSGGTKPAGSYVGGTSPYGALDMAGNVWEWVVDWYSEGYYQSAPYENPINATEGKAKVMRGGSWRSNERNARSANRGYGNPVYALLSLGFRCALSP